MTDITIRVFSMSGIHNVFFNRYSGTIFVLEFFACLILQLPNLVNTHIHSLTQKRTHKNYWGCDRNFMKSISLLIKTIDHFTMKPTSFLVKVDCYNTKVLMSNKVYSLAFQRSLPNCLDWKLLFHYKITWLEENRNIFISYLKWHLSSD